MFVKFYQPDVKNIFACNAVRLRHDNQELYINNVSNVAIYKSSLTITLLDNTFARINITDSMIVHLYVYETQEMHIVRYTPYERLIDGEWREYKKLIVLPV